MSASVLIAEQWRWGGRGLKFKVANLKIIFCACFYNTVSHCPACFTLLHVTVSCVI